MKRIMVLLLFDLLFFAACRNSNEFGRATDGDLTVMAIRTKEEGIVKARVVLDQVKDGFDLKHFTENMQYQLDSCFYVLQKGKKSYPLYVTPMANGLGKTYEYILGFENEILVTDTLVYNDRHRSKKNIKINFK